MPLNRGLHIVTLAAEIHALSVAFDGPTSMHPHTNTHVREEIIIKLNISHPVGKRSGNFLTGVCAKLTIRYGETSSLRCDVCSSS